MAAFPDDLQVLLVSQQPAKPVARERLIIHDQNPNLHVVIQ